MKGDVFVAPGWTKHPPPQTYDEAADKMWQTTGCWRQWINISLPTTHGGRACSAALTLKG